MMRTIFFVVQGRGHFPDDMLRYDVCLPINGNINGSGARRITLRTGQGRVTKQRWSSFGWTVCGIADTADEAEFFADEVMGPISNFM